MVIKKCKITWKRVLDKRSAPLEWNQKTLVIREAYRRYQECVHNFKKHKMAEKENSVNKTNGLEQERA